MTIIPMRDSSYPPRTIEAFVPVQGSIIFRDSFSQKPVVNMSPAKTVSLGQQDRVVSLLRNSRTKVVCDQLQLLPMMRGGGVRYQGQMTLGSNKSYTCTFSYGKVFINPYKTVDVTLTRVNGFSRDVLHSGPLNPTRERHGDPKCVGYLLCDKDVGNHVLTITNSSHEDCSFYLHVEEHEDGGCNIA